MLLLALHFCRPVGCCVFAILRLGYIQCLLFVRLSSGSLDLTATGLYYHHLKVFQTK